METKEMTDIFEHIQELTEVEFKAMFYQLYGWMSNEYKDEMDEAITQIIHGIILDRS